MNRVKVFDSIESTSILGDVDNISDLLAYHGILIFKEVNYSIEDQKKLSLALNRKMKYSPSNENEFHILYEEDHSHATELKNITRDEILIDWHLEHSESEDPQVMAIWNMITFCCPRDCGETGFVRSDDVIDILSEKDIDFLSKSLIIESSKIFRSKKIIVDDKGFKTETSPRKAIQPHPFNATPVLRVDPLNKQKLFMFNNKKPNIFHQIKFIKLYKKIYNLITKEKSIQYWHQWSEGDMVIVDLFTIYHAVKGGFSSGERKFIGFWSFGLKTDF